MNKLDLAVWIIEKFGLKEALQDLWKEEVVEYENPIDELYELDDDVGKIYVWKLKDGARKKQASSYSKKVDEWYKENIGHESRALHIEAEDIEEIKQITAEEYKRRIPEWVKD